METTLNAEIAGRLMTVATRANRALTEEELTLVRARIERDISHREEMRVLPLENADAPVSGLAAPSATHGGQS